MYVGNVGLTSTYAKWFMQIYQFRSDGYRLYYLSLGTGITAQDQFRLATDQKFLLRQIKAIDVELTGEQSAGAAVIVEVDGVEPVEIKAHSPVLLTLYGHRLAAGGSFAAAQSHLPYSPCLPPRFQGLMVRVLHARPFLGIARSRFGTLDRSGMSSSCNATSSR
jgi:hypothetical protein